MGKRLSDASDSDWGEDADSGKSIQPGNFPNSVAPNQPNSNEPEYQVIRVGEDGSIGIEGFCPGTTPWVADVGGREIYLGEEGMMHVQIMRIISDGALVGPIVRGYLDASGTHTTVGGSERDAISDALSDFTGRGTFMSRVKRDPAVCPVCDELVSECDCLSWGEGADWANDPIDQSSIREMKPGIQASQKKAAFLEEAFRRWPEFTGYVPTQLLTELLEYDRFGEDVDELKDSIALNELKDSIAQNGVQEPVLVEFNELTGEAHVSEGNHRVGIAEQLGLTSLPVFVMRSSRKPYRPNGHRFQYVGPYHDREGNPTPPQYMHPSDIGLPVVGERTSSRKTALRMFHVSPSFNRDLIASEGLNGHERGLEEAGIDSPWTYKTWDQPPGNYFFPNKQDAYAYVSSLTQSARSEIVDQTGGEFDIYEVDVDGLPMFMDPEALIFSDEGPSNLGEVGYDNEEFGDPARAVTPDGVPPRRIRLIDTVSESLDAWDEPRRPWDWDFDGMPGGWERLPMTEVPWPGHDLNPQERAAAWDKPLAKLSPRESSYVLGARWMPSEDEAENGMFGGCLEWAIAHQQAYPELSIGMHYVDVPSRDVVNGEYVESPVTPWHFFTHDDQYAYDTDGVHQLPYQYEFPGAAEEIERGLTRTDYGLSADDAISFQEIKKEIPSRDWILRYAPNPQQPPDVTTGQKQSKETAPQRARRWEDISQRLTDEGFPYVGSTVHEFDDGWTVRHHTEAPEQRAVGEIMNNCWRGTRGEDEGRAPGQLFDRPAFNNRFALHDDKGMPQVAFNWEPNWTENWSAETLTNSRSPKLGLDGMTDRSHVLAQPLAARNNRPDAEHLNRLADWAASQSEDPRLQVGGGFIPASRENLLKHYGPQGGSDPAYVHYPDDPVPAQLGEPINL